MVESKFHPIVKDVCQGEICMACKDGDCSVFAFFKHYGNSNCLISGNESRDGILKDEEMVEQLLPECLDWAKNKKITRPAFKLEGAIIHYIQKQPGQIRLISDSANVLTGEIGEQAEPSCLYSRNKNLIDLIKNSLTNEIKLIQLQKET